MYYSSIKTKFTSGIYPKAVERAIEYLKNTDLESMECGVYEIEGKKMIIQLFEDTTLQLNEKKPESHIDHIDLQYLVFGNERIGVTHNTGNYEVSENLLKERDLLFYKSVENETMIEMKPGNFAVFFPEDVHRPCCMAQQSEKVRKAVIKIHLDLLK